MRIFHVTDIHLHRYERADDWAEQDAILSAIVAEAEAARPDLIILGGDWDHLVRQKLPPRLREAVRDVHRRLAAIAPVLSLRGNHDLRGDLMHLNDIPGVLYVEGAWCGEMAGAYVCAVPYPDAWEWCPPDVAPGARLDAMNGALRQYVRDWLTRTPTDKPRVIAYHGDGFGAVVKIGQHRESAEASLTFEDVDGATLVACGHIHTQQDWRTERGTLIAYGGQTKPEKFGDPGQESLGGAVYDVTANTATLRRFSLAHVYRRKLTYELEWADGRLQWLDGTPWDGLPARGPLGHLTERAYVSRARVKARVRYPASARAAVQNLDIRGAFLAHGAHEADVHPDVIAETRRPTIAAFAEDVDRTLAEEIDMVMAANGTVLGDGDREWLRDALVVLSAE